MSPQPRPAKNPRGGGRGGHRHPLPRIVLKYFDHLEVPVEGELGVALEQANALPWSRLRADFPGITIDRLHASVTPQRLQEMAQEGARLDHDYRSPNLLAYFTIDVPLGVDPQAVLIEVRAISGVEYAYIQGLPSNPNVPNPGQNPRYNNQGYLQAAPGGINAHAAWAQPGGDGQGTAFVDMEQGWYLNHEDLVAAGITEISGANQTGSWGHGTDVLGEIIAVDNTVGGIGIVPHTSGRTVGAWQNGNYNIPAAISSAASVMAYGDVLLLEQQIVSLAGYNLVPVELEAAIFDAIRLAVALGITVVEAGANGGNNLDNMDVGAGKQLNRNDPAFQDSGAILVGAGSSTAPHSRLGFSNYGSRVDCYAWGENIDAPTSTSAGTNDYTTGFGGTSGASPMIVGASLAVQGMALAGLGFKLSPRQLREFLKAPNNSTASQTPATDLIGRMPDLAAIIGGNALNLAPDIYIRDYPADDGSVPRPQAYSNSPDVIVTATAVANPTATWGPGSGTENNTNLGDHVVAAADNHVYVRLLNRGGTAATGVTATVFWSPPASLVTPNMWNKIGSVPIPNVPVGRVLTVSDQILWQAAQVPAPGHYCFVALIGDANQPAPDPGNLLVWANYVAFIQDNNQAAWHNLNVNAVPGARRKGFVELPFVAPGAPLESVRMGFEVEVQMPEGGRAFLDVPWDFIDRLKLRSPWVAANPDDASRGLVPLMPRGRMALGEALIGAGAQVPCRFRVQLPAGDHPYQIAMHQKYQGLEVGRVGWHHVVPVGGGEDEPPGREEGRRRREDEPRSREERRRR